MKRTRIDQLDIRVSSLEQQVATVAAKVDMLVEEAKQQRQEIKEITRQLHSNFIQTLIGVGAIMVAVGGLIISVLK